MPVLGLRLRSGEKCDSCGTGTLRFNVDAQAQQVRDREKFVSARDSIQVSPKRATLSQTRLRCIGSCAVGPFNRQGPYDTKLSILIFSNALRKMISL